MRQTSGPAKEPAEAVVTDIRRATRKHYSAEEKIRIVLTGLRGEDSIAELCRREGISQNLYYRWSREFLEAGKKRLAETLDVRKRLDLESCQDSEVVPALLSCEKLMIYLSSLSATVWLLSSSR